MAWTKRVFHSLASLRLTLCLLGAAFLLVFFGTLAQVEMGIQGVLSLYFKSFFVLWPYPKVWPGGGVLSFCVKIPLIGGYTLGILTLANLFCAHLKYFKFKKQKLGIALVHLGLGVLVLSGFVSAYFQEESQICLTRAIPKNYSEDYFKNELVVVDISQKNQDSVWSIPQSLLKTGSRFEQEGFPPIEIVEAYANSCILRAADIQGSVPALKASSGLGYTAQLLAFPQDLTHKPGTVNTASAYVKVYDGENALGTWLVSSILDEKFPPQEVLIGEKTYQIALRFKRTYFNFSLTLLEFMHERHPGTDIPKSFSSLIRIQNLNTKEDRQALISMNQPLRYEGYTFYQSSFSEDERSSILQVVKNPGWVAPYVGIVLVGLGLCFQFIKHLLQFLKRHEKKT